jgi:hypothetical protein
MPLTSLGGLPSSPLRRFAMFGKSALGETGLAGFSATKCFLFLPIFLILSNQKRFRHMQQKMRFVQSPFLSSLACGQGRREAAFLVVKHRACFKKGASSMTCYWEKGNV